MSWDFFNRAWEPLYFLLRDYVINIRVVPKKTIILQPGLL